MFSMIHKSWNDSNGYGEGMSEPLDIICTIDTQQKIKWKNAKNPVRIAALLPDF
jgi:hypothetical protein